MPHSMPEPGAGAAIACCWRGFYNTGARVSEAIGMRVTDVDTASSTAAVHLRGKGRKERRAAVWRATARLLEAWLAENSGPTERPDSTE